MSAFSRQLPVPLGVVIGAPGPYAAVVRGDRMRFRRERDAHWQERRFAAYADCARSVNASLTPAYRGASALGAAPHPHPLPPLEAGALPAEATAARDPHWEALLLLGGTEVVERARARVVVLLEVERFARAEDPDRAARQPLLARQRVARGLLHAVRAGLGLPAGYSARRPLPPLSGTP